MHDPMTVAFEIKYPWRKYPKGHEMFRDGYRETFITIWHVDPEVDGSDDSCGWHAPKAGERERAFAKELADWEEAHPYYFAQPVIHQEKTYSNEGWGGGPGGDDDEGGTTTYQTYRVSPGDCVALVADIFATLRWRLDPKCRKWGLTPKLLIAAMNLGANDTDNFQSAFAFWDDERHNPYRRREKIERTFLGVIRNYRRITRPWWRHPRWHLHHWQIQVRPLQTFKRWAFTRCYVCGGRFKWGETGLGTWDGEGPSWRVGRERLSHINGRCDALGVKGALNPLPPSPDTAPSQSSSP